MDVKKSEGTDDELILIYESMNRIKNKARPILISGTFLQQARY
jgi:hypothetical protein